MGERYKHFRCCTSFLPLGIQRLLSRSYSCFSILHSSLLSLSISPFISLLLSIPLSRLPLLGLIVDSLLVLCIMQLQTCIYLVLVIGSMLILILGHREFVPHMWELFGWDRLDNIIYPNSFCHTTLYCLHF